jgi:hypothetical protein
MKCTIYKIKHQLPLKPSHKDDKHQFPPQISKARSIEGFIEDISQLSLGVYVSYFNVSLLYMVSQEVMSPIKVSHSLVEDMILTTDIALVLLHMRETLTKLTPKSLMLCMIHRIWMQQLAAATYSPSMVDWATEDYF